MLSFRALIVAALSLAGLAAAKSSTGDSVLVVLEPRLRRDNFSTFFDGLEERGYKLTFRSPKDDAPAVTEHDVPQFSNVIIFAPETKSLAKDLSPQALVDLLGSDTNLLLALSTKQTSLTSLAAEFNIVTPPPGTPLISHFPQRDEPATVLPVPVPSDSHILTSTAPVWYSGIPIALGTNPYLFSILNAPAESFGSDATDDIGSRQIIDSVSKGGEGLWAGSAMSVAAGFQTRNGARVAWVGGVSLFNNTFAEKEVSEGVISGNKQIAQDIAAWAFQENSAIRIDSITHHLVNQTEPKEQYTTSDMIVYTAHISKYNGETDAWEPYSGIEDLQLEFTMLDPHIRTSLPAVPGRPGQYSVTFRAPDRHGVFKFVLDYKRKGWSHLFSSTTVPVVPPRHDGYPRFLSAAWPYYAGAISTSVGFLLFSALFLASDPRDVKVKAHKKTE